jgi:hypothetical protein
MERHVFGQDVGNQPAPDGWRVAVGVKDFDQ